jgi:hypothetical protein
MILNNFFSKKEGEHIVLDEHITKMSIVSVYILRMGEITRHLDYLKDIYVRQKN